MSSKTTRLVELTANGDADQVEARLREALDAHGPQLLARIDHAAGARKADVELEANVLLIFGNPSVGTLKGANIGVAASRREGWEDRRHGLLLPLPRRPGAAGRARS
jgi:hypothetical protein